MQSMKFKRYMQFYDNYGKPNRIEKRADDFELHLLSKTIKCLNQTFSFSELKPIKLNIWCACTNGSCKDFCFKPNCKQTPIIWLYAYGESIFIKLIKLLNKI